MIECQNFYIIYIMLNFLVQLEKKNSRKFIFLDSSKLFLVSTWDSEVINNQNSRADWDSFVKYNRRCLTVMKDRKFIVYSCDKL